MRQRNREKKFKHESAKNKTQELSLVNQCEVPCLINSSSVKEDIVHDVFDFTITSSKQGSESHDNRSENMSSPSQNKSEKNHTTEILLTPVSENHVSENNDKKDSITILSVSRKFTDNNRDKDKSINNSSDDLPETKVSIPTKSQIFNSSSSKVKVSISTESQISDSSDSAQASMAVPKKLPELLIKNESDIDALIILLRQKFKMSEERLEQWRANIAFELRDNKNYWKKERESMSEANFLEHKQNFEAKM
ncbi:44060_t:CDS:2 [Gigaspora margarita]|uniref:44060_t:CDS:1 n=1 Tax=Gigaspora margarita TaxID=4874 RepID=A0ABN7VEA9_GIGMA|nr:44060_t:CDS:2 [Gigaspora margarita]